MPTGRLTAGVGGAWPPAGSPPPDRLRLRTTARRDRPQEGATHRGASERWTDACAPERSRSQAGPDDRRPYRPGRWTAPPYSADADTTHRSGGRTVEADDGSRLAECP